MTDTRRRCNEYWAIYDRWVMWLAEMNPDDEEAMLTAKAAMVAELDAHVKACADCK